MTVHNTDYHQGGVAAPSLSDDKRNYARFPTRLRALYYMSEDHEGLEKCDIVNVSHGGLGIRFKGAEAVKHLSTINLGIVVKWHFMPISLQGMVKWVGEGMDHMIGGIELAVPLDNITLLKLI